MWNERRQWWSYPYDHERHPLAALFHLISLFLVMISLVQLDWFNVKGCEPSLFGPKFFLTQGHYDTDLSSPVTDVTGVVICYHSDNTVHECVTREVHLLMRVLVFLCLLSMFSCMVGFCLDVIGPSKKSLRFIRRNALPSIAAVLCIISMIGVSYFLTTSLEYAGAEQHPNRPIQVSYDYGFYAIAIAGGCCLVSTACNVLQEPVAQGATGAMMGRSGSSGRHRLMEDDPFETFTIGIHHPPPPPPYTP